MKVVILCGGQGTRLREETEYRPKPLVLIGGKPILWHIMMHYSHFGFKEFVLCLGYKGHMIRDYFLNFVQHHDDIAMDLAANQWKRLSQDPLPNWQITLADTGEESMTGGRILRIKKYIGNEPFFMTYGDAVCSVDLKALLRFHQEHKKLATVTGVPPLPRFGELEVDKERVLCFNEKPKLQHGIINGGYFVLQPEVFGYLENDQTVFEQKPLENLARQDQMRLFHHQGFWQCVDTFRDFKQLNEMWDQRDRPWVLW